MRWHCARGQGMVICPNPVSAHACGVCNPQAESLARDNWERRSFRQAVVAAVYDALNLGPHWDVIACDEPLNLGADSALVEIGLKLNYPKGREKRRQDLTFCIGCLHEVFYNISDINLILEGESVVLMTPATNIRS